MDRIATVAYCRESEVTDITALCQQSDVVISFIYSHPDLVLVNEYNDLGTTGWNFKRPGWEQLVNDLEAGKFQCIVVRELSRLGRNHIEVRDVMDMLAEKNIRLIGIWDHVDTAAINPMMDFQIDVENFINDMYLRDTSRIGSGV